MESLLEQAAAVSRQVFGYETLRAHQSEVLRHVLSGQDCLAVLPTGSGKSMTYALPALIRPGLVLVISPLIALIRDQVRRFAGQGVACASLDSTQTSDEKDAVWARLAKGELQLLLVSPERLARQDFGIASRKQGSNSSPSTRLIASAIGVITFAPIIA